MPESKFKRTPYLVLFFGFIFWFIFYYRTPYLVLFGLREHPIWFYLVFWNTLFGFLFQIPIG